MQILGGEQIGLLDVVENGVFAPDVVLEAPISGGRLDHRLAFLTHHALQVRLPEIRVVLPERELAFQDFARIRHHLLHERLKAAGHVGGVQHLVIATAVPGLALDEVLHQAPALLGYPGDGFADLGGIRHLQLGGVTLAHGVFLECPWSRGKLLQCSNLPR